jgi:hypothetical protein
MDAWRAELDAKFAGDLSICARRAPIDSVNVLANQRWRLKSASGHHKQEKSPERNAFH